MWWNFWTPQISLIAYQHVHGRNHDEWWCKILRQRHIIQIYKERHAQ
jgi:hypothetical protein